MVATRHGRKKNAVADPFEDGGADTRKQSDDDDDDDADGKKKSRLVTTRSDARASPCVQPCTYLYLVVWCLHYLVPLVEFCLFGGKHGAYDVREITSWELTVLLPLNVALLVLLVLQGAGSHRWHRPLAVLRLAVAAHVVDFMIRWGRMPLVWDHEYWGLNVNACFVLCYVAGGSLATSELLFLKAARLQLGLLYVAAAFWKLTTSFLDYRTSCGTVLIMEFFATYTGTLDAPLWLVDAMAKTAPLQTILIESTIGVGMLYAGTFKKTARVRDATVILATVFHIVICLGPVNYAGGFSIECMTRFLLFFDSNEIETLTLHLKRNPTTSSLVSLAVSLGIIGVRYAAIGAPFDVTCFACGLLCAMYFFLVFGAQPTARRTTTTTRPRMMTAIIVVALGLTTTYGFVLPILGLQQMGAPTMYANVRYYDGGNHLLVPVGTLGEDILFGGGVATILYSTSPSLNMKLGHVPSSEIFPPRVVKFLTAATRTKTGAEQHRDIPFQMFPMCMDHPHSKNALMEVYAPANPPDSNIFRQARLPNSVIERTVKKSLQENEDFVIKLSTPTSDSEEDRVVVLNSTTGSQFDCKIVNAQGVVLGGEDACIDDAFASVFLPQHEPKTKTVLSYLVDKLLEPYPELVGFEEEVCMS